jgi:hypothetical protein
MSARAIACFCFLAWQQVMKHVDGPLLLKSTSAAVLEVEVTVLPEYGFCMSCNPARPVDGGSPKVFSASTKRTVPAASCGWSSTIWQCTWADHSVHHSVQMKKVVVREARHGVLS